MSAVFGSLTLVGIYLWTLVLFGSQTAALISAFFTLFNQFLFVQARTATLDVFFFCFAIWAMWAFVVAIASGSALTKGRWLLAFSGVLFGLSMACKWIGVLPWAATLALAIALKADIMRSSKGIPLPAATSSNPSGKRILLSLLLLPLTVYFVIFGIGQKIAGDDASAASILRRHSTMYSYLTTAEAPKTAVQQGSSSWWRWPLKLHPEVYAFRNDPLHDGFLELVVLYGNPIVMWGGIAGLVLCLWDTMKSRRNPAAFVLLVYYAALYLTWALSSRKTMYYYYYYGAAMVLGPALAYVFHRHSAVKVFGVPAHWFFTGAAIAAFAFFYPVLSGIPVRLEWVDWWF